MNVAIARIDAKARLVIPKRLRQVAGLHPETAVILYGFEEFVFLRKADIGVPSMRELLKNVRR